MIAQKKNTLESVEIFHLDLDVALNHNKLHKNIPNYTIPFLSALLSEAQHGIVYSGDVQQYLYQVAQRYHLPMLKWDEVNPEWLTSLQVDDHKMERLLALFAQELGGSVFQSFLEFSAIEARTVLSPTASTINQVVCADFGQAATAFICACHDYQVTLYHHKGLSSHIDQTPYEMEIAWVFQLLFPQMSVKESIYFIDEERSNLESLMLEESFDYDCTALVGDEFLTPKIRELFSYIVTKDTLFPTRSGNTFDNMDYRSNMNERIKLTMAEDKKSYIKADIAHLNDQDIIIVDHQHPGYDVFMLNIDGYEYVIDKDFIKLLSDDDYCTLVNTASIIANRYNFSARYYAKDSQTKSWLKSLSQFKTNELSDLVTFHRPPVVKPIQEGDEEVSFYEVALSNINEYAYIHCPRKEILVSASDAVRIKNEGLEKGDILFAIKGDLGRVGLVMDSDLQYIVGKAFIILRLKSKALSSGITPEYLVAYLADKHVKHYISHLNTGTKVDNIRMDDLKSIPIITELDFIEQTIPMVKALESQRNKILNEQSAYEKLKESLSNAIAGSREHSMLDLAF
jgi:hypothetical protein